MVPSPALAQITGVPGPIAGRVVGVVAGPDSELAGVAKLRKALAKEGAVLRVIAETGGKLAQGGMTETVDRTLLTTRSIEYDAVIVSAGTTQLVDPKLTLLHRLGAVTRGEALAGLPDTDIEHLLRTLQALKANLTDACVSPVAGQKRVNHG